MVTNIANNVLLKNLPQQFDQMLGLSLIIIRNKKNQYIAIKETENRGWWIPGGRVDPPEDFFTAAVREAKEEAGLDIKLKGILKLNYMNQGYLRLKVIFYAEPINLKQEPKKIIDKESEEARWVSVKEFQEICKKEKMRGDELIQYGNYIDNGGTIYPLSILSQYSQNISENCNNKMFQGKLKRDYILDNEQLRLKIENLKKEQNNEKQIQNQK